MDRTVRWRKLAVPATVVAALAMLALPASAWEPPKKITASYLELVGPGPSYWDMYPDDYACVTVDQGVTPVSDGALGEGHAQDDAFDGGLIVTVEANGVTKDLADKDGVLDLGEDDVRSGGVKVGGLKLWRLDRVLSTSPTLRSLISFRNGTDTAIVADVWWDSNLGSDGDEDARATGSGDTTFDTSDGWLVTSDDATAPSDPVLTFALFGDGARATPREVFNEPGSGCLTMRYRIRVPAHSTRYLLFFTQMSDTNERAIARAPRFDAPPEKMLTGLDPEVRSEILNWAL